MTSKLSLVTLIIISICVGTLFYSKECNCNNNNSTTSQQELSNNQTVNNELGLFSINGREFNFNCNANINFTKSNSIFITPLHSCIDNGIEQLKNYLNSKNDKVLIIEGYAKTNETNSSDYESLALARAEEVKKYFVNKGINENKVYVNGMLNDDLSSDGIHFLNPISIRVDDAINIKNSNQTQNQNSNNAVINEPQSNITNTLQKQSSIHLTYNLNNTIININSEQNQQLLNAIELLKNNNNLKLKVEVYGLSYNINITNNRAEIVKDYFLKNNISSRRIFVEAKTENNPVNANKIIISTF